MQVSRCFLFWFQLVRTNIIIMYVFWRFCRLFSLLNYPIENLKSLKKYASGLGKAKYRIFTAWNVSLLIREKRSFNMAIAYIAFDWSEIYFRSLLINLWKRLWGHRKVYATLIAHSVERTINSFLFCMQAIATSEHLNDIKNVLFRNNS